MNQNGHRLSSIFSSIFSHVWGATRAYRFVGGRHCSCRYPWSETWRERSCLVVGIVFSRHARFLHLDGCAPVSFDLEL